MRWTSNARHVMGTMNGNADGEQRRERTQQLHGRRRLVLMKYRHASIPMGFRLGGVNLGRWGGSS